jgi:hypothetical protein
MSSCPKTNRNEKTLHLEHVNSHPFAREMERRIDANANCEVVSLDCVLLLMDTVSALSGVMTIAYRVYRTPVRYSIH